MNWTAEQKTNITKLKTGPFKKTQFQRKVFQKRPLFDRDKILLPPLHIKLGLLKNFVQAMNKHGNSFEYLKKIFPQLSDAKL